MYHLARNFVSWLRKRDQAKVTILIIGLDGAGKSTMFHDLQGFEHMPTIPTVGVNQVEKKFGKYEVNFIDMGGGSGFRNVWKSFYYEVHGAIFVVDSADQARMEEAREELLDAIQHEKLAGKPVLIFANKQDLEGAVDAASISAALGLEDKKVTKNVQMITALASENKGVVDPKISEGVLWLCDTVKGNTLLNDRVATDVDTHEKAEKIRLEEQRIRVAAAKEERRKQKEEDDAARARGETVKKRKKYQDVGVIMCAACPEFGFDPVQEATQKSGILGWRPACDRCIAHKKWLMACEEAEANGQPKPPPPATAKVAASGEDGEEKSSNEGGSEASSWRVGDRVESKVAEYTEYYPGKIGAVNSDGTYDIEFDDGDRKAGVPSTWFKEQKTEPKADSEVAAAGWQVGDRVESKVADYTDYYPGIIGAVNDDGTYDIEFDDGDRKGGVSSTWFKDQTPPRQSGDGAADTANSAATPSGTRETGSRVDSKVADYTEHYPGVIDKVNEDGTYNVKFDDGDYKENVPESWIAQAPKAPKTSSIDSLPRLAPSNNLSAITLPPLGQ